MTRRTRIELADALYHVTSRGDRRETIVADDSDRARLTRTIGAAITHHDARLFAYCLMDNHYHLVVYTRRPNLSAVMQQINGVYAQSYNRRHGITGHLFQGRFHAIHVDRDAYFLEVCRYVDMNPMRARVVDDLADWRWSSWRSHVGIDQSPPWLHTRGLYRMLLGQPLRSEDDLQRAAARYREFTRGNEGDRLWQRALHKRMFLGDERFAAQIEARLKEMPETGKD